MSPGIDTGDVIAQRHVRVDRGDTLESLRPKHQAAAASLLLEAVEAIGNGTAESTPQALEAGRQYYRMHPALRAVVEAKLANGGYSWIDRSPEPDAIEV